MLSKREIGFTTDSDQVAPLPANVQFADLAQLARPDHSPPSLSCERTGRPKQKRLIVPLHQLEGDTLGPLEEPQLSADVVHLVAQHDNAMSYEVRGGRLDVVDAER